MEQAIAEELSYTVDLVRLFLDWRHNVLTRFAVAATALGAAAYLADQRGDHAWSVAACVAGALLSATALALDRRNSQMLRRLLARASRLEVELSREAGRPVEDGQPSFLREWADDHAANSARPKITYTAVLRAAYGGAIIGFGLLAIL